MLNGCSDHPMITDVSITERFRTEYAGYTYILATTKRDQG